MSAVHIYVSDTFRRRRSLWARSYETVAVANVYTLDKLATRYLEQPNLLSLSSATSI